MDLNDTVVRMRDLLQATMGGSVQIQTILQPDLWPAMIDPTQIELVILNLAINARDAMEVGGSLTVETANVALGAPAAPEEPAAGDYVMVAVTDTGSGMSPDILDKVFEPFFTTKEVGKGSGLASRRVRPGQTVRRRGAHRQRAWRRYVGAGLSAAIRKYAG